MNRALYIGMVIFYFLAGLNHFIMPDFYYGLIPDYLPFPKIINTLAGIAELTLAGGLLFPMFRRFAAYGIVVMLIAFIPSHIYFIEIGSCVSHGLCVPAWVGWVRLIVIHPLLILWAIKVSTMKIK